MTFAPVPGALAAELGSAQFARIRDLMYQVCGVHLRPGKEALVRSRLARRLQALALDSFDAYLAHLERDGSGSELREMVESLTTNKTGFFREPEHFTLLRDHVKAQVARGSRRLRLWSAGCSSGEEPYTMAMMIDEALAGGPTTDVRILATDIASRVLRRAREGVYGARAMDDVPLHYRARYFGRGDASERDAWRVRDDLRAMVSVGRLNLAARWPMRGPFDAIFCRNVMIYFDEAMRRSVVERCWELLAPHGLLFVGHSESLSAISHRFRYVQPAVYAR